MISNNVASSDLKEKKNTFFVFLKNISLVVFVLTAIFLAMEILSVYHLFDFTEKDTEINFRMFVLVFLLFLIQPIVYMVSLLKLFVIRENDRQFKHVECIVSSVCIFLPLVFFSFSTAICFLTEISEKLPPYLVETSVIVLINSIILFSFNLFFYYITYSRSKFNLAESFKR